MADARGRGRLETPALVWKRFDFRESSRLVTLLTRDHGRVQVLAKGAHRPDSPFLGRIDFLNDLQVVVAADRGGLRLLLRAELLRERRGLRAPARFLAASHLVDLADPGFPADRPDPELFDLLTGGLLLLERCPEPTIPVVVLGLELRYLQHLGALPDLTRCGVCGRSFGDVAFRAGTGGTLTCRAHAESPRIAVANAALTTLDRLRQTPGRALPELPREVLTPAAVELPARWLERALDRRSRLRPRLFAPLRPPAAGAAPAAMDSRRPGP